MQAAAVEAKGLVKAFGSRRALNGIDLTVESGTIFGVLGPNGAGKTTTLRTLLGIIDPDAGERRLLGHGRPLDAADQVGYMPEERGLYPAMSAIEAIAFMGALRGLHLREGRRRARAMLISHGLGDVAGKPIRTLSKGMAQTVQLLGTIVHGPRLIVLDEPFSGLDAINQTRLEQTIRDQAKAGATVLFSTHVIAHAERLCEKVAIIARGSVRFAGTVSEARGQLQPRVRLSAKGGTGAWRAALPATARDTDGLWTFKLPAGGITPLLDALVASGAEVETLSIERPSLHDAFVSIVGDDAAPAQVAA